MKVELTLPALERLIGGETEIEFEARRQIVENFATHHIKAFVNDKTLAALNAKWKAELEGEIKRLMDEFTRQTLAATANPDTSCQAAWKVGDFVKGVAEKVVGPVVDAAIQTKLGAIATYVERKVRLQLEKELDLHIAAAIQKGIQDGMAKQIDALVATEIERRCDLLKNMK